MKLKKLLKKLRNFWWKGKIDYIPYRHRNDEDIIIKNHLENPLYLERFGYKVYSQNDEDGILEEIFNRIGTTNRLFIEFGVQSGLENNTHYLLHKGWSGLWIEGDSRYYKEAILNFKRVISEGRLEIVNKFITKDNINTIIKQAALYEKSKIQDESAVPFPGVNIDLLSIDIDGNDYWVWDAINCIKPRVIVIEYNVKFPPHFEWIMEYDESHWWNQNDNMGASLKALELLGTQKGYQLVGTNLTGSNAFFVRKDLTDDKFPIPATSENLYNPWGCSKYRYVSGHKSEGYIGK